METFLVITHSRLLSEEVKLPFLFLSCTIRVKELYLKATLNLRHYLIPQRDSKDLMEIHLYRKKSWNCK